MTPRREALLGRFRTRSLERTRRLAMTLLDLEAGRGDTETVKDAARELHTLKGDCTVVGMELLSRATHSAEGRLLASRDETGRPSAEACADVRRCLEVVDRVLKQELTGAQADEALHALVNELGPPPAPSAPPPSSSETAPAPTPQAPPLAPDEQSPAVIIDEPAPAPAPAPAEQESQTRWMQVQVGRVDDLCERVSDFAGEFRALTRELLGALPADSRSRNLHEALDRARGRLDDLIGNAWALRLVPVEPALEELVRHAHGLAEEQGKRIRVQVDAQGAEVERSVLDELWEPLLHLVRNAVDHGIEVPKERTGKLPTASLVLRARPSGPHLLLTIADDGRGIDLESVRATAIARGVLTPEAAKAAGRRELLELIFQHGFSTRAIASNVSGRGVGLDVVRERTEALGGTVSVYSDPGMGTRFELKVPTTITRERAVVLAFGELVLAVPSSSVVEVVRLDHLRPVTVAGGRALPFRDEIVPLRSMAQAVGAPEPAESIWALVLEVGARRWAFTVGQILGEQDLLRRPVDALLAPLAHIAGSAALDDGRLALVASVAGLVYGSEVGGTVRAAPAAQSRKRPRVLVVDDSLNVRDLIAELLTEGGMDVSQAGDGREALQVLNTVVPDLVLTDFEMPNMDGMELLKEIRARWPHLPVVVLTTRGSAEDRRRAAVLGANAYLVKTEFEESSLLDNLRRFLGHH